MCLSLSLSLALCMFCDRFKYLNGAFIFYFRFFFLIFFKNMYASPFGCLLEHLVLHFLRHVCAILWLRVVRKFSETEDMWGWGGGTTVPISHTHGKAIPNPTLGRKWFSMELRNNKLKSSSPNTKRFGTRRIKCCRRTLVTQT